MSAEGLRAASQPRAKTGVGSWLPGRARKERLEDFLPKDVAGTAGLPAERPPSPRNRTPYPDKPRAAAAKLTFLCRRTDSRNWTCRSSALPWAQRQLGLPHLRRRSTKEPGSISRSLPRLRTSLPLNSSSGSLGRAFPWWPSAIRLLQRLGDRYDGQNRQGSSGRGILVPTPRSKSWDCG